MGILIAIRRNLATDLISIDRRELPLEDAHEITTILEDISIDFPENMLEMGKMMTEVYLNLFIFENNLRNFIEGVSIKSFGIDYWEKLNINKNLGKKIKARKKDEMLYKWLSSRGDSDLLYTDLDDLRVIISSNWKILFKNFFPKETWIITYLGDIYKIRNKIAHNVPIEENERNTVQTLINNIYNQLEVRIKYITLFGEIRSHPLLEEDKYDDSATSYKIDFDLIFNYFNMIEKGEIPAKNLESTFYTIDHELKKLEIMADIDHKDLVKLENIIKRLLVYIKKVDDRIEYRILEVLHSYTFHEKTMIILKNQGYTYFVKLFEKGKDYSDLLRILDLFGYFDDKIENILVSAIENNKASFLGSFSVSIDFSQHMDKRINIIRALNQHLAIVPEKNKNLIDKIKSIIRKFERSK